MSKVSLLKNDNLQELNSNAAVQSGQVDFIFNKNNNYTNVSQIKGYIGFRYNNYTMYFPLKKDSISEGKRNINYYFNK